MIKAKQHAAAGVRCHGGLVPAAGVRSRSWSGRPDACCSLRCGRCGGHGCVANGLADHCCYSNIMGSGRDCKAHQPPCMVYEEDPPFRDVVAPPARTASHHSSYTQFMAQLYCSAAEEGRCSMPERGQHSVSGECYWQSNGARRRWQPPIYAVNNNVSMHPAAVAKCLARRRVLLLGDSMTRDTFYEILAELGRPIFANTNPSMLMDPAWMGRPHPSQTGGKDRFGDCAASSNATMTNCMRDIHFIAGDASGGSAANGAAGLRMCTRYLSGRTAWEQPQELCEQDISDHVGIEAPASVSFFFMTSNSSSERKALSWYLLRERPPYDVLALSCPVLSNLLPNAYNYSQSRKERHTPIGVSSAASALAGVGAACKHIINQVRQHSPGVRIFLLGFPGLFGLRLASTRRSGADVWKMERLIFRAINDALGLRCVPLEAANVTEYRLIFKDKMLQVVDRMNVWGNNRGRDNIHPIFPAQRATVKLLLNEVCGTPVHQLTQDPRLPRLRLRRASSASTRRMRVVSNSQG